MTLYIYSEAFEHVFNTLGVMYPASFDIVECFLKTTFLLSRRFDDAHAFDRIENLFEVRKNRFVLDVDCELRHIKSKYTLR